MAFDQNLIPKDLRPLNVARTGVEEPRITPPATALRGYKGHIPNAVCDVVSHNSVPVIYPAMVSDVGSTATGYGNVVQGVSPWCPRAPAPASFVQPAMDPSLRLAYSVNPNTFNHLRPNGVDVGSGGLSSSPNLSNQIVGNCNDVLASVGSSSNWCNLVNASAVDETSGDSIGSLGNVISRDSGADRLSDEGGDGSLSGKMKFLCSFGGKILPRPSDRMLRYVGGQTRIISVRRDVSFDELAQRFLDAYGQPVVIKYQLPGEDLDALVSVSCPDDLDNMLDEYEKLIERSSDGSPKLRVFLFSASELDYSGMEPFVDFHDCGQKYVDAVNGLTDGVGAGISTRKESTASATSTHNSDFSGTDPIDGSNHGQGNETIGSSPRRNSRLSNDTTPRVNVNPFPVALPDASTVSLGFPVVNSGLLQATSSQPEVQLDWSVPISELGLHQPGTDLPPPVSYPHSYLNPHQETHIDYVQIASQMGYPNPQVLGAAAPVLTQPQIHDNIAGLAPSQLFQPVQMTMVAPSYAQIGMSPNVVLPSVQPQHIQLDHYVQDSPFMPRAIQLPADQSYGSYQVPTQTTLLGGGFIPHPVPSADQVIFSDGLVPHQQVLFDQKFPRMENCYMCQHALPHAHSDTLAQDKKDSGANLLSEANFNFRSLQVDDNLRARQIGTGALKENILELGAGARTHVVGHLDGQVGTSPLATDACSQNLRVNNENERIPPNLEGIIGRASEGQSPYVAFVGNPPQSFQDDVLQPNPELLPYPVGQNTRPTTNYDDCSVRGITSKTFENVIQGSPEEYSDKLPGPLVSEDYLDVPISYDRLGIIDDNVKMEDNFLWNPKSVVEMDVWLDEEIRRHKMAPDTNHNRPPLGALSSELMNMGKFQPVQPSEVAELSSLDFPGQHPQANIGIHPLECDKFFHGRNPQLLSVGLDQQNHNIPSHFHSKVAPSDVEAVALIGDELPSKFPHSRHGDVPDSSNSLFSEHDPWNFNHDARCLPPKPTKILSKKDLYAKEPFRENHLGTNREQLDQECILNDPIHQPLGDLSKDFNSERVQSEKGSAEEQIKQDLQAVAECVAASVLQSASSSNADIHERIQSNYDADEAVVLQNSNIDKEPKVNIETTLLDKANLGFPVSDGLGRLQMIRNSDLEEMKELGSGTYGTVYHGKWRGTDVAIKRINDRCFAGKPSEKERLREDFWNEAIKLADLHHPNVVAFYGVVLDGPGGSVATVTEYMVNGSLRNALQKNEKSLDKRKRLLIAMDAAFGMEYLHSKNIVHFDLKSDNLLVNLRDPHRPICKVGDLGLSKVKCQTLISGGVRGTLPWMAPELLNGSSSLVSEKVDVFSFGIVMWELLTGEEPYADMHYGAIIGGIVSNTLRPPVPEYCDAEWKLMMERCWSTEQFERPSFTEIANELRSMAAKLPPKGQNQQQLPSTHILR